MNDPYKVLGVTKTASDDEIKSAYRELARKYHPDNYIDNPLSELANEKMQEINAAYEQIRSNKDALKARNNNYSQNGSYNSSNYSGSSNFADVRRLIQASRITEAQELLDGVSGTSRDAEWYYLKGVIFYTRGWLNDALAHFRKACDLDPNNPEYSGTLNQLLTRMNFERQRTVTTSNIGCCGPCSLCSTLICADCTCSAFRCCFN